jgi:hypothetical protein
MAVELLVLLIAATTEVRDRTQVSQNVWWHGRNTGSEKWSRQILHFSSSAICVFKCIWSDQCQSDRFVSFREKDKNLFFFFFFFFRLLRRNSVVKNNEKQKISFTSDKTSLNCRDEGRGGGEFERSLFDILVAQCLFFFFFFFFFFFAFWSTQTLTAAQSDRTRNRLFI